MRLDGARGFQWKSEDESRTSAPKQHRLSVDARLAQPVRLRVGQARRSREQ
jgi:hypothetical protein